MTNADPNPTAVRRIGPYRIIALIGVGASSTVYRAVRPSDNHQVAIKLLADNHSMVAESRRRFGDESRLLASIDHPGVATVYEVGETADGQPYMVLELANRGDLKSRVDHMAEQGDQPTAADVRLVAEHLGDALGELHRHGIVHRDLSPYNLLIRRDDPGARPPLALTRSLLAADERLLLADLGFAKRLDDASGLTRGGGTRGFAAPEQRDSLSIVDHRADIYSATALVAWLADQAGLTDRLSSFLDTGLALEADERHGDMAEWLDDFGRSLDGRPSAARREHPPDDAGVLTAERLRGGRVPALVVGSLIWLGAIGWLALTSIGGNDPSPGEEAVGLLTSTRSASSTSPESPAEPTAATPPIRATATTVDFSTAVTSASSSGATSSATSVNPSTTATGSSTVGPSTRSPTAGRTTANLYPFSPRAYLISPGTGETVNGDLQIVGTARGPAGIDGIRLVVRHIESTTYWNPTLGRFDSEFVRFDVEVDNPGEEEVGWTYDVARAELPAGPYRIRSWARGSDGTGDPVGEFVEIIVG